MSWQAVRGPIVLALLIPSCVSGSPPSTVQIYSWWTTASEELALQAVTDDFAKRNPNVAVVNIAANNALSAGDSLQSEVRENDPPDTFQLNGGIELQQYIVQASPNPLLQNLDGLAQEQNWEGTMPPAILQAARYGGDYYAVPVDIARVNALFYNKAVLANAGIASPPSTLAEFVADAELLAQKNQNALVIGGKAPWALEVIFKSCLLAAGQANYYTRFISGTNPYFSGMPGVSSDPTFNQAIDCFATYLAHSNKDQMRQLTWADAVAQVAAGNYAMTVMGDWAHGEFLRDVSRPNVDFGEAAAPDTGAAFIYTTDAFVFPVYAKNPDGAMALLKEWGSPEGQSRFFRIKGSLPSRSDADPSQYDVLQQWTLAEFKSKTLVPDWALAIPQAFTTNFDAALDRFADDGNAENVVLAAKNNYDMLLPHH